MKKHLILSVVLLVVLTVITVFSAQAAEAAGGNFSLKDLLTSSSNPAGFEYSLANNKITITSYTGTNPSVVIPSKIDGYTVTAIGDNAFKDNTVITAVTIPSGITTIGATVFSGCINLATVNYNAANVADMLSNETQYISNAFNEAGTASQTGITVNFGDSVQRIPAGLFAIMNTSTGRFQASQVKSVTMGKNIQSIGQFAFTECQYIENISLGSSLTSIESFAFYDCTALKSIIIPDSVTSLGTDVFFGCTALKSAEIGDSITSISSDTFINCTSLVSVRLSKNVTSIGSNAFNGCTSLTDFVFTKNILSVDSTAFSNCTGLTSIAILGNSTVFDSTAFSGITALTTVRGYANSTGAQTFATAKSLTFKVLVNGDYDDNGTLSATDYNSVLQLAGGMTTDVNNITYLLSDYDADGAVDAFDAFKIGKAVFA